MARSGSTDFSISRADIIQEALEICGVVGAGETPAAEDTATCVRSLNMMTKALMASGTHLWLRDEATLWLVAGQESYLLGGTTSAANCTTDWYSSTLSAAEASGQTALSVTTTSNMTSSDNVAVEIDDDTYHWSTISSYSAAASTATIAAAIDGAAASGNTIYWYTDKVDRPQRILDVFRRTAGGADTPLSEIARTDYARLSDKDAEGAPNVWHYDRQYGQGRLYIWPVPDDDNDYTLQLVYDRLVQDFDDTANEPDFPVEWFDVLSWNLADRIALKYGVDPQTRTEIKQTAIAKRFELEAYDAGTESVCFAPERY